MDPSHPDWISILWAAQHIDSSQVFPARSYPDLTLQQLLPANFWIESKCLTYWATKPLMAWSHYSESPYENISFSECQFWALSCGTCKYFGKCERLSVWIRIGITNLQTSGCRKDCNISYLILTNPIRTTKDLKKCEVAKTHCFRFCHIAAGNAFNIHSWIDFYSSLTCFVLITTVLFNCTQKFCNWRKNCSQEQICSVLIFCDT